MTYTFADFAEDFAVRTNEELDAFELDLEADLDEDLLNGEEDLVAFFRNF